MKLSASFLITVAIYVCFNITAEVVPILHLSKLILPILILVMLHGTELRMLIMLDFLMFTLALLKVNPVLDSIVTMYILGLDLKANSLWTAGIWAYIICGLFFFKLLNFVLADRVIKSKKLRERIGFATFSA